MPDPKIFKMPIEFGLNLDVVIRQHFTNEKWKFFNDVIIDVNRDCLHMFLDFEGT